ncbi:MAG: GYF domain-containing protein [Myxococcales bacterium]
MDDDSRVIDKGWDALPEYGKAGDADDAVTVSISTTPGEWLVNTVDSVVVPMSMAEVVEALQAHKLTERSLVWRAGMPEWAAVDKVPQLKLAARMAPTKPSSIPPRPSIAVTAATPSKPPPKPVRDTAAAHTTRTSTIPPQSIPSRKGTLPFGLPTPLAGQSRPGGALGSSPRAASAPPASKEEPEVLAVYARPAATISFDLSPVEPPRTTHPVSSAPQTLAPTTTDSAQRRAPVPRNADLSVVAASDFRQVQRSSKRLVWISSLASAAAASLITFAVSRGGSSSAPAAAPPPAPVAAAPAPPAATPSAAPLLAPTPSAEPAQESPPVSHEPAASAAPAKPKPARRAKAVSAAPRPAKPPAEPGSSTQDPSSEPNPYDVKLDEDPPAAKPAPAKPAHGSGLEADGDAPQASSASPTSPGF